MRKQRARSVRKDMFLSVDVKYSNMHFVVTYERPAPQLPHGCFWYGGLKYTEDELPEMEVNEVAIGGITIITMKPLVLPFEMEQNEPLRWRQNGWFLIDVLNQGMGYFRG